MVGSRALTAAERDCRELASAMELAISVAIDPLSLSRPPVQPPPPAPTSLPEPPPRASTVEAHLRASIGALGTLASEPGVTAGPVRRAPRSRAPVHEQFPRRLLAPVVDAALRSIP